MDYRKNVAGLNVSDVESALGNLMIGSVPNNYMLVRDAIDRGVQFCEIEEINNVTSALTRIILKDEADAESLKTSKSSLVSMGRNFFKRKSA
jgi:pilus assembly protein CpaE